MNYYRRFMGDYQRDTSHLSVIEHGAYTLLLDHYYSKRTPLPATLDALYRLCRAMTTLEQEAVRVVVEEFFPVGTDGLRHNPRADKEIAVRQAFCAQQAELSQRGVAARRAKVTAQSIGRSTGQATDRSTEGLTVRSSPPSPSPSPESGVLGDSDSRPRQQRAPIRPAYQEKPFHDQLISAYHELLPDLPKVKGWSKRRAQALNARIRERLKDGKPADTIGYWRDFFNEVAESDLLCGRKGEWRADLEWLLRPENFLKVIEGRYAPRVNRE